MSIYFIKDDNLPLQKATKVVDTFHNRRVYRSYQSHLPDFQGWVNLHAHTPWSIHFHAPRGVIICWYVMVKEDG